MVEPGQTFDAEHDRVLFIGAAGPMTNVVVGPYPHYLLNGVEQPKPMDLRAGATYRFRLIDLADGGPVIVSLMRGKEPVTWRAIAKDGAALPASQATSRPATLMFDAGEIYDYEFTPAKAGDLALTFGPPPPPPGSPPPPPTIPPPPPRRTVVVHVK